MGIGKIVFSHEMHESSGKRLKLILKNIVNIKLIADYAH